MHASGTGGGPTPQRLILTPLEELLRGKLLPVVVEGLAGDRDIGIYPSQFPPVAPGGHVSPETEQVSSPGSCSSTHLEEHDDEDDDDDDATAIDTEIQSSEHEEVPIETVLPPNRPSTTTYDAIVASEGKIVEAENRRHSDLMTVLERMISLQEETISQLAHLHRVFIEVPKQLQKINTSFEALVVQQTQANYLRMTTVPHLNFNTSQAGSLHAGHFSPHSSELHSPGPNSLRSAVAKQKTKADRHRQKGPSFKPGDLVWVSSKNIRLKTPSPKLSPRFLGPFKILEKVNPVAYRLELPPSMKIPSVFHVSLLKEFVSSPHFPDPSRRPSPVSTLGQQEYKIQSLIDSRVSKKGLQFLLIYI
ncbi:uncharacterized protein LOC142502999 [Ascaphus truei]|uniref:uncharacterized protein LOC142502999 n=1 Tax=Ascaphus truei TaxID=8439 RepID=UPI003F59681A